MKKFLAILLFFSSFTVMGQSPDFEGVITYQADYKMSMDQDKINKLKQSFGDSLRVYFRGNDYKQHYRNSKWLQEVTYLGGANKYYMLFQKFDTIYTVDCSISDDNYTVRIDSNDRRKILGYDCIKLVMQGERTKKTYYFAPALGLKEPDFSKHKMGGYDLYMQNARAVYLYSRVENQSGVAELKAVKIEKKELPDKVFDLLPLPKK
jgi:hypothetical protein